MSGDVTLEWGDGDYGPTAAAVALDAVGLLREQNADPAAFAVTSGYVVISAAR